MSFIPLSKRKDTISSLTEKEVLFLRWIAEQQELELFLCDGTLKNPLKDRLKRNEHQLAEEFYTFLTPYVLEQFSVISEESTKEQVFLLGSLFWCLDAKGKNTAERRCKQRLESIFETKLGGIIHSNEEKLTQFCQELLQGEMVQFCLVLSPNSYSFLLYILETAQQVIKANGCSKRLALWIIGRLQEFPYNHIHQKDIEELKRTILEQRFQPSNKLSSTKWRFPNTRLLLAIGIGILLLITSLWFFPEKEYTPLLDSSNSSLEGFTTADLKYIDSILKKDPNSPERLQVRTIDPTTNYLGNGMTLELRTKLKNKRMGELVKDMLEESDRIGDSLMKCTGLSFVEASKLVHAGVDEFHSGKTGNTNLFNGTSYLIEVYIFQDTTNGKIKRMLLPSNGQVRFDLKTDEYVCFVPGRSYVSSTPSNTQHPGYTHEFCKIDANYLNGLNRFYQLDPLTKNTNFKILLIGNSKEYFDVLEFNRSLIEVD